MCACGYVRVYICVCEREVLWNGVKEEEEERRKTAQNIDKDSFRSNFSFLSSSVSLIQLTSLVTNPMKSSIIPRSITSLTSRASRNILTETFLGYRAHLRCISRYGFPSFPELRRSTFRCLMMTYIPICILLSCVRRDNV